MCLPKFRPVKKITLFGKQSLQLLQYRFLTISIYATFKRELASFHIWFYTTVSDSLDKIVVKKIMLFNAIENQNFTWL